MLEQIITTLIGVAAGSIVATVIVMFYVGRKAPALASNTAKKAILSLLTNTEIQENASLFVREHIVHPFEQMENNADLKSLITETAEKSLELALNRLKEEEKK